MQSFLNTRLLVSGHLVIVLTVIVLGVWSVYQTKNELRTTVIDRIEEQRSTLNELATLTDRNGADAVVASIIVDCPKRSRFERLLGKLASLERNELLEVQQLFESCGGFYAERKAIMVARLTREVELLNADIDLLSTIDTDNEYRSVASTWGEVVTLEAKRSTLLMEQVRIQRDVISSLIQGRDLYSNEIQNLSSRAQNITDQLVAIDIRIDQLRTELTG